MNQPADVVLFSEIATGSGGRIGMATLNNPRAINALSLDMIRLLAPQLARWADDPDIAVVVLNGNSPKGFCAGGDLRSLYKLMNESSDPVTGVEPFFREEYNLDYSIHIFPKPILCWGHGIVMGGGIGLMSGASHRVVTTDSRLAMPEITVGLYPDVGASWFLNRIPFGAGLFLALTGAVLNAADALVAGLADFIVQADSELDDVLDTMRATQWSGNPSGDRATLTEILSRISVSSISTSNLIKHADVIRQTTGTHDSLPAIAGRIRALPDLDPWLGKAKATFAAGAPSTAAVSHALYERARRLSLKQVFELEYVVSTNLAADPDFAEGIRALLIDKDRTPRWAHSDVTEISDTWINQRFTRRAGIQASISTASKS